MNKLSETAYTLSNGNDKLHDRISCILQKSNLDAHLSPTFVRLSPL